VTEPVTMGDQLRTSDAVNDPVADPQRPAEGIELACVGASNRRVQRIRLPDRKSRRHSIRVNDREYEAPHVTFRSDEEFEVRILLNGIDQNRRLLSRIGA